MIPRKLIRKRLIWTSEHSYFRNIPCCKFSSVPDSAALPDQETVDHNNFKPGYKTTSNLIKSYLNKEPQHRSESLEVDNTFDIPVATGPASKIRLFRERNDGARIVNHKDIFSALEFYERTKNVESAMYLCNRMNLYGIVPLPRALTSLIKIVENLDSHIAEDIYLNLLFSVRANKTKLNHSTFGLLTGKLRYIKDSYTRETFRSIAQDLIESNSDYDRFKEVLLRDYAISCMNDGDMERSYTIYQSLSSRSGFPVNRLVEFLLIRVDGLEQALQIFEHDSQNINQGNWLLLLEECIENKHREGAELLWSLRRQPSVPQNLLLRLIPLIAQSNNYSSLLDICRSLTPGNQMNSALGAELINAFCSRPASDQQIGRAVVEHCVTILSLQPNLKARQIPRIGLFISDLCSKMPMYDIPRFLQEVTTNSLEHDQTAVNKWKDGGNSDAICTLLMNATLVAYLRTKLASQVMALYGHFVDSAFTPDTNTLEVLVSAAHRLGNSKKLSYTIYNELVEKYKVKPSRLAFERIIRSQLVGKDYSSIFQVLVEMGKWKIPLRQHLNNIIAAEFSKVSDQSFTVFQNGNDKRLPELVQRLANFPTDSELEQASISEEEAGRKKYNASTDIKQSERFQRRARQ